MTDFFHSNDSSILMKNIERSEIDNFALRTSRFLNIEEDKQPDKYNVKFFCDPESENKPNLTSLSKELVQNINLRQNKLIESLSGIYDLCIIDASINWRLVIGLGGGHIAETNMTLHHTYGIPYIPGSALKGLLRHYFLINILEAEFPEENLNILDLILSCSELDRLITETDEKLISTFKKKEGSDYIFPKEATIKTLKKDLQIITTGQSIFGTQDSKGKVIFLDAFPVKDVKFAVDIMNPHYPDYYQGKKYPTDCQNPNPILFLTIEDTIFRFVLIAKKDSNSKQYLNCLTEWIGNHEKHGAFNHSGIGAKTAVGYGYFKNIKDKTKELESEIKTRKEKDQQEFSAKKEKERLEKMSPVDRLCDELKNLTTDDSRSHEIFKQELDKFEGDEQIKLAEALKEHWEKIGKWKKTSKKQKAKVDRIKSILNIT